ncbi:MAG: hypothetical protein SVO01_00380 [Thermotogota bacterium]|nr:hypothetical protein [Thermotogota bacterium]
MELKDFVKSFGGKTFKPSYWQEKLLEKLESDSQIAMEDDPSGCRWYKHTVNDYFTCNALKDFQVGQRFALATIEGVRVFEMIELHQ